MDKRNRAIEEDLNKIAGIFFTNILDCNFQVFKLQLNPKHKADSFYQDPTADQIVTVFVSGKISPFVKSKEVDLKIL